MDLCRVNSAANSLLSRVYSALFLHPKFSFCATRKYLRNQNSLPWMYISVLAFENSFITSVKRNTEPFLGVSYNTALHERCSLNRTQQKLFFPSFILFKTVWSARKKKPKQQKATPQKIPTTQRKL